MQQGAECTAEAPIGRGLTVYGVAPVISTHWPAASMAGGFGITVHSHWLVTTRGAGWAVGALITLESCILTSASRDGCLHCCRLDCSFSAAAQAHPQKGPNDNRKAGWQLCRARCGIGDMPCRWQTKHAQVFTRWLPSSRMQQCAPRRVFQPFYLSIVSVSMSVVHANSYGRELVP